VTDGTHTTTLVTNSYDQDTPTNATGINEHYSGYGTTWLMRGNVTTSVTPSGTTQYYHDIAGNVTTTYVNGLVTTSTVSSTTNYAAPSAITTISLSSSLNYSAALGVTSATGPNGDNLGIVYDANNRPHTTTAPTGAVTTFTYNDNTTPPTAPNKIATTNGHWVQTNMDGFGRTIQTLTGYGTTTVSQVDTVYVSCGCSPIGKMGQQSAPHTPTGAVYWTTYTYDGLGRTTQKELPDGSITHYSYAGNTVTVSDPAGKSKTFTIDALGNLTQVQEPNPVGGALPAGTPVFSPAPGTYTGTQTITITTTTAGASIRYTTDGSTPSETAGTLYSGPVSIPSTATLKAIAYASGSGDSSITSGPYTINSSGTSWYNTAWGFRKLVTIAHGQVSGSSNLTNFPMLSSVTDSNLAASAQANGNDILFTASDGVTKLNHEIELYTSSTGHLIAWVQIPTLSPTADTAIYVYYGNASAPNQQNATAVWDSNYKGVWHLPNGTTLTASDSTSNGNNGIVGSGVSATSGQIDGAAAFSSSDIDAGANSSLYSPVITVSAWLNASSLTSLSTALSELDDVSNDRDWILGLGSGGTNWRFVILSGTSQYNAVSSAAAVANSWHYVVGVYDGTTESIYVDGSLSASTTVNAPLNTFTNDHFLMGERTGGDAPWPGAIDEVRYSNAVRPAAWIATEYNNQNSPSAFSSEGSAQSCCGGSGSTQATAPVFSPGPGNYTTSQSVSITSATSGATIRYTVDGSTPSETNGTVYTGPVGIAGNETLQAIAYESGLSDSPVTSGGYTVETGNGSGPYLTNYTYDILNHLTGVSMPRGSNNQTRTFNYTSGTTVGINLLSAANPENGTVTYTYNSDNTLHTKTDAKSQVFTYSYDSYKRLTQIMVGSTVLRTFIYDTNNLDSTFSGSYTAGRLVAVQNNVGVSPIAYVGGVGGNGASVPSGVQFTEMYGYTQAGLTSGKRLQVQENFNWYTNNNPESSTQNLNMDAAYTYDIEGKATSVQYPSTYSYNPSGQLVTTPGPKYTYSFDSMDRPTGLTDQSNTTDVSNVTYNAANQLLGLNYLGIAETRQYNNLNQMTNLTAGSLINITYTYPAGANNGKISQQAVSGETVTYQYDSLNRLLSATSNQSWSESYGYDGFGNLLSKTPTGGAPTLSQAVNAATNQLVNVSYDANGNQLDGLYSYDAENRLALAPGIQYGYDSRNKRVWSGTTSGSTITQTVYFYGVDGQRLGIYSFTTPPSEGGSPELSAVAKSLGVYFGSKRVGTVTNGATASFTQDRLGSNGTYYPYGEARGTETQDDVGFATYTNDSATGLEYADQRYYASNFGRFMTPDRYEAKARGASDPGTPLSWNRYSYVLGDAINALDPSGRWECDPNMICTPGGGGPPDPVCDYAQDCGGGGGGGGDEYPTLNCQVEETVGAGSWVNITDPKTGTKVKTWVTPIWLSYTATGGDGNYNFFESQYFVSFNLVSVQGAPFKLQTYPWGPDGLLNYEVTVTPDSTTYTYNDAPGFGLETVPPNANFLAYSWTAFFTSVSVTSGDGQTVNCPTVEWQNFTTVVRKNGREYGFGTNSIISVY
jgi:RHS repeat-associated protein